MMRRIYLKGHVAVTLCRDDILLSLTAPDTSYQKRDYRLKRVRKKLAAALRDMDSRARKEMTVIFTELEALAFRHHVISHIDSYSQIPERIQLKGLRNKILLAEWSQIDPRAEQHQLEMLQNYSCIRDYEQSVHDVYLKRLRDFSSEAMLDELQRRGMVIHRDPIEEAGEEAGERIMAFYTMRAHSHERT